MGHKFLISLIVCLSVASFTACVTMHEQIWPQDEAYRFYHYEPKKLGSVDEAISNILNLEKSFTDARTETSFSSFVVEPYAMRARWMQVMTTERHVWVPQSGGYFIGYTYVPINGGLWQKQVSSSQIENMIVIPFNEVEKITIFYYPGGIPFSFFAQVFLKQKDQYVLLRVADEISTQRLVDAISTLAIARGCNLKKSLGLRLSLLTPAQSADIGLVSGTGVLIKSVAIGSPAEKIGIQFLDVIVEASKLPVNSVDRFFEIRDQAIKLRKKSLSVKIRRKASPFENTQQGKTNIIERVYEIPL